MKRYITLLIITFKTIICVYSQITVYVDGLYYHISGTTASIAAARQEYYFNFLGEYIYRCRYQKSEYTIPSTIEYNGYNYTVVSIEEGAFADQRIKNDGTTSYYNSSLSTIKKITIPNTITHIGAYAFYGCRLEEYYLPNTEIIGEYAFAENRQLKKISAPNLQTIGDNAFKNNSQLVEVDFPSLESIGNNVFSNSSSLTSIVFPESLLTMGNNVFDGCI